MTSQPQLGRSGVLFYLNYIMINKVLGSQEEECYSNIYEPYTLFCFCFVTVIHCKTQRLRIKCSQLNINLYDLSSRRVPTLGTTCLRV